ncbi:hypothetical protein H0A61_01509 [Koleobacter methoxysyntrophicus]|uniref:HEPN domain-containing protein n=2 Tax=Koleobacter methoxysyntrophicus TaxID=2751313 RepID=A0A8A0RNH7_9FIRM|nr:hypothetical protein H0A61_01509 [Koleobacter methoxysyntrophicus]
MRKSGMEEGKRWLRYPNGLPDSIPAKVYNREIAIEAVDLAEDAVSTADEIIRDLVKDLNNK